MLFLSEIVNWPSAGPVGSESSLSLTLLVKINYFLSAPGCSATPAFPAISDCI